MTGIVKAVLTQGLGNTVIGHAALGLGNKVQCRVWERDRVLAATVMFGSRAVRLKGNTTGVGAAEVYCFEECQETGGWAGGRNSCGGP